MAPTGHGPAPVIRDLPLASGSTWCYLGGVIDTDQTARAFKTAWFAKAARKSRITDDELCDAMREVVNGQADDLGGGVFKKRLNRNMHRGIVLAKGGRYWVYAYLFAKSGRANIDDDELEDFRTLAKGYAALNDEQVARLLKDRNLTEICHVDQAQVQERYV